jgi:TldD protein
MLVLMESLALNILDLVSGPGVTYADVRAESDQDRHLATKNGQVAAVAENETTGVAIRVLKNGAWGFAATDDLSKQGLEAVARLAVEIAEASAVTGSTAHLAPEQAYTATWQSHYRVDPFSSSPDSQIAILLNVDRELRRNPGVTLAEANLTFSRRRQWFVSTLGSRIHQDRTWSGAGFAAHSYKGDEIQKRSYPNSFGGQYQLKGYELVEELDLLAHAPRVADEAVSLHSADLCPEGEFNLILDGSQLGLQIHESIGHPIELDRVLGDEANYAGLSFLSPADIDTLRYGSDVVNVVCDATAAHGPGLGTFAFDDEGVPAQSIPIIDRGLFRGFMSSRETAARIGQSRSNGTMRADHWSHLPLIRMTNVSLLPGERSLEQVFDCDGIYMETNKSWSIDDKRYQFQFGCEIAWEIRGGRRVRMLRNPTYGGVSTRFWNACRAVADSRHWTLWGVPNCGKGQPEQVIGTGHGASPSRFEKIAVTPSAG